MPHLFIAWAALSAPLQCPEPALTVRVAQPDEQCTRLLDLFSGSRSPHPAAALAAWRRATGKRLDKTTEALIAAFNPAMAAEWKTLDGFSLALRVDPAVGRLGWSATVPRDDGTFAALVTALVLTEGTSDEPLGAVPVDRLGPPGAPVAARAGGRLVVAGARDDLRTALAQPTETGPAAPGLFARLDPSALGTGGPVPQRQAAEALRALGCREVTAHAVMETDALAIAISAQRTDATDAPGIEPRWLDWVPADSALAAAAWTVDARPEAWDHAFAVADRVERADPARAAVAPLRTRLNLLAAAAQVRPEVDIWPVLRGVTACVLAEDGAIDGVLVALHTTGDAAAERLVTVVLPRLRASRAAPARLGGRPLGVARRGATVALGWGDDALARGLRAYERHDPTAGRRLSAAWREPVPPRAGLAWPGRLRVAAGTALARADVPPVLWWGRNAGRQTHDVVRWPDLRAAVRRFLDRLPLDPPPDR